MRRIVSRAAVLIGGVAAGWLVSTASASADVRSPEVVESTMDLLAVPVEVETALAATLPEPPAPPAELAEFGRQVHGAVQHVTSRLHLPTPSSTKDIVGDAAVPRLRLLTADDQDALLVVLPQQEIQPPAGSLSRPHVAEHDYSRHPVSEPVRRTAPNNEAPELPALPTLPLPLAPPTAPTGSCTTSCGHGPDDDLGTPVAHTWPNLRSGSVTSRALQLMSQHVATAVGEQPGVTPD
jgi:hypothetical protein